MIIFNIKVVNTHCRKISKCNKIQKANKNDPQSHSSEKKSLAVQWPFWLIQKHLVSVSTGLGSPVCPDN